MIMTSRRIDKIGYLRVYLHGTTLSHATSLRQAYNMTYDYLHLQAVVGGVEA